MFNTLDNTDSLRNIMQGNQHELTKIPCSSYPVLLWIADEPIRYFAINNYNDSNNKMPRSRRVFK